MIRVRAQFRRDAFALDVNLHAAARVTGVFGPSGAGKTTLMHLIAGLETPDSGEIALGDVILFSDAKHIRTPVHRRGVGMVFQEHRLFPHLSVRGNLRYGVSRDAQPGRVTFDQAVELLELAPLLNRKPGAISGGERQRVALGRALLSNPRVLLMDEPLVSLDARLKRQIIPFLKRTIEAAHVPVLYVSHDLAEIQRLTDSIIILDRGRIAGHGTVHECAMNPATSDLLGLGHASPGTDAAGGYQNILPARVSGRRAADGMSELILAGPPESGRPSARIIAPLSDHAVGADVSVVIFPHDISLASQAVPAISIQNQIPVLVRRVVDRGQGCIVELDAGLPIIAEISRAAARSLALEPGRPVVMLVKSQAVRIR